MVKIVGWCIERRYEIYEKWRGKKLAHELTMEYIKHNNTIWQDTVDNLDKITSHYENAYKKFYELIVKTDI